MTIRPRISPLTPVIPNVARQSEDLTKLDYLYRINDLLGGYVIKNILLTNVGANTNTIGVTNPNLYQVASEQYGDATLWTAIANANGLTDPFPVGSFLLIIPPKPTRNTGGILGL